MAEQNATNSASSSIGEVQAVTGRVIAIGANGVERQLFAGDQIYPDDLIRTIGQGTIKVALKDGPRLCWTRPFIRAMSKRCVRRR